MKKWKLKKVGSKEVGDGCANVYFREYNILSRMEVLFGYC